MIEQLIALVSGFVLGTIEDLGYVGIFVLMTISSANIPMPSEVILPSSGFLVGIGKLNFWSVVAVGVLGDLTGCLISYSIAGRIDGRLRKKHDFQRAERWFQRFGELAVFLGRVTPLLRSFMSLPAGVFKVRLSRFILLSAAGSFIWVTSLTYLGFVLGDNWQSIGPYFRKFDFVILGALIVILILWLRGHMKKNLENRI